VLSLSSEITVQVWGSELLVAEEQSVRSAPPEAEPPSHPPPPKSSIQIYQLTFGTVCGVCAGVFVKKGAKILAFVVGGVFVLLQVLYRFYFFFPSPWVNSQKNYLGSILARFR
jgi:hypothetical protein